MKYFLAYLGLSVKTTIVVVSPPVNFMKDQATKLANIGIPAVTLSDIREENMRVVEYGAREGLSLLFTEAQKLS